MWQIFVRFLSLGLVSFGGPAAHIGYFRQAFVSDLKWLDDKHYASLVALSQLMPGPGSSQVGFAIGYHKGGLLGGVAAFIGFTLPSFILLFVLAVTSAQWLDSSLFQGAIHGFKLLAVVVVADAVWIMFNQFCRAHVAKLLMLVSCTVLIVYASLLSQVLLLVVAAATGVKYLAPAKAELDYSVDDSSQDISLGYGWLALFIGLFAASLAMIAFDSQLGHLFGQFYQAGSLVFGGGHVVLPLLETIVGDAMSGDRFLTGYALAQAVPGPMFALAAFLGAELWTQSPLLGALVATLAIFLPGFILMLVALKTWSSLSARPNISGALAGINACVVGFLISALYMPVFTSAVIAPLDMALVIAGFGGLKLFKPNILFLVLSFVSAGILVKLLVI
ncbi:chromate efflux transporter [Shewanella eurypsychrophilus]|uniref:Chromate efflux transporter n=1 Tax=Shewanella eurypsychrophilus TaxID=2593656 RepID=A0ABX6V4K8_9GAMM|nr:MULTISPECIES: chromate efflux transporter [Shewanella]QFU21420.1 chromate efflux transporter [Shewanella sp. YLB-09]QPG56710.1 chromate efflux transporter [Shewanella eurypsychrophilus]